jgi:N-methylhydantoinase A
VHIANENMANAIRLVTIERGIDPRDYALVAFGGAGPLHACGVARAVGIRRIVVPPRPGLCSALGAAIARPRVDRVWSVGLRSDRVSEPSVRAQFEQAERAARGELESDGLAGEAHFACSLSCRYYGQNYEQEIQVPNLEEGFLERAADRFHDLHEASYTYAFRSEPVEFVHAKVTVEEIRRVDLGLAADAHEPAEHIGERDVIDDDGVLVATRVLRRGHLAEGQRGPLLIEEMDSTVYVPAGWQVRSGEAGCLVLEDMG